MAGEIDGLHIRTMTSRDISGAMFLVESAHWNQTPQDWQMILTIPGTHLVAIHEKKIVGSICSLDFETFVWLAMVLVHPDYRRQGIATVLMKKISDIYHGRTLRLDATENGARVYENFNFQPVAKIFRWQISHRKELPASSGLITPPASADDFSYFSERDKLVFGGNRSGVLSWLVQKYPQQCLKLMTVNTWAYVLGRPGNHAWQIGPLVADSLNTADSQLCQILAKFPDQKFFIDTFAGPIEWHQKLLNYGFTKQRTFVRMQQGPDTTFGLAENQFAIGGPEIG